MRSETRLIWWWVSLSALVVAANLLAVAQTPSRVLLVLLNNANQLGIIDPVAGKVVARVPTGEDPHGVAASADGKFAFTANANSNTISVIDLAARKEVRRVALGPDSHPHDILVAGGKVYFTLEGYKAVGRYDPASNKVDWLLGTGQNSSHMMVMSKDMNKLFTANRESNSVSAIEGVAAGPEKSNVTTIPVGKGSEGIAISPDDKEVWTANWGDAGGSISIIDVATKKVTQTINTKAHHPNRMAFTPDGKRVFVLDRMGGETLVLDAVTRKEIKRFKLAPNAMLVAPDGARAYLAVDSHVPGGDEYVAVIDVKTLAETGRIPTGGIGANAMAWAVTR